MQINMPKTKQGCTLVSLGTMKIGSMNNSNMMKMESIEMKKYKLDVDTILNDFKVELGTLSSRVQTVLNLLTE